MTKWSHGSQLNLCPMVTKEVNINAKLSTEKIAHHGSISMQYINIDINEFDQSYNDLWFNLWP